VLLTIASEARYLPFAGYDFLAVVTKALQRNHNAMLIAVGPKFEGRWVRSSLAVNGRIGAKGRQTDLDLYYACADIYLPSFPLGGLTAMLDAGLRGIPVVAMFLREAPKLCGADDVALDGLSTHASTPEEYVTLIEQMIADPSLRHEKGAALQTQAKTIHTPPGWNGYLEDVLRYVPKEHRVCEPGPTSSPDLTDVFKAGIDAISPNLTLGGSFNAHAAYHLPLMRRIAAAAEVLLESRREEPLTRGRRLLESCRTATSFIPPQLQDRIRGRFSSFARRLESS
jgi:hypothetical protein